MYDEAVTEALVVLWEASDRVCGKRLKALPTLMPTTRAARAVELTSDPRVREQLIAVSAATIDRRVASARAVTAGQRRRRRSGEGVTLHDVRPPGECATGAHGGEVSGAERLGDAEDWKRWPAN